eukprot:CAMPEP_0115022330 /NCGR_PEP_ID=MMETSP0216-20121206/31477_1 /TAXON_ID=223996 /ORGANISM="Protocruzia adherens, Strain Boccale" /LENGTH=688 /DNA_ID=CAMNT_0002394975 /DNA_START=150 /DNA_END=2216 /DNA_ORIENTATION=-
MAATLDRKSFNEVKLDEKRDDEEVYVESESSVRSNRVDTESVKPRINGVNNYKDEEVVQELVPKKKVIHHSDVPAIKLSWEHINITAKMPKKIAKLTGQEKKDILQDLNGHAYPGEFLAILGPSGAGKTTFLNYLSGRLRGMEALDVSGKITLNDIPRNETDFAALSAYVMQDDILYETLTVRECLWFSARLRVKGTDEERNHKVDTIIEELGLTACANTKIGGKLIRGVSGGERKRTSIGVELVTDPPLLFLDEPTTGLDSFTALTIMEVLRKQAAKGRTIISTIHQPSSEIFTLFDKLMLMMNGHIVYHGPISRSIEYFGEQGFPCPALTNPADYFMKVISPGMVDEDDDEDEEAGAKESEFERKRRKTSEWLDRCDTLVSSFNHSGIQKQDEESFEGTYVLPDLNKETRSKFKVGELESFTILMKRSTLHLTRNPMTTKIRAGQTIVFALMIVILYTRLGDNRTSIQDRNGALFFQALNTVFSAVSNVIVTFPIERAVFLRERANDMYSVGAYFWAKNVIELPFSTIFPVLFVCIFYYTIGLSATFTVFLVNVGITVLLVYAGSGYGLFVASFFSDVEVAVALTPLVLVPFILFAGLFVNTSNIPVFLAPLEYLSLFKYGFIALATNEYENVDLSCEDNAVNACEPLSDLNFDLNVEECAIILAAMTIGYRIFAFIVLKLGSRGR